MSEQKKGGFYCVVRGCHNRTLDKKISFFRLPNDLERANHWLAQCNRGDLFGKTPAQLKGYRVCAAHFEESMFGEDSKNQLLHTAVPSIFPFKKRSNVDVQIREESEEGARAKIQILSDIVLHPVASTSTSITEQIPMSSPITLPNIVIHPEASTSTSIPAQIPLSSPALPNIIIHPAASTSTPISAQIPMSSPLASTSIVNSNLLTQDTETLKSPVETQTTICLSSNTPRKQKLRGKIKYLQRKIRHTCTDEKKEPLSLDDFHKICMNFLPRDLADFVKIQAELTLHKPKGRRYTSEYKKFALSLYFLGPRAYKFLQKLFYLPSKRSLERITEAIVYRPGLNNEVLFKTLRIKALGLLEQDRHCLLCIDEMSIKANLLYHIGRDEIVGMQDLGGDEKEFIPAQSATVIMARGLYSNWKQPIAYYFVGTCMTAKDLELNLKNCVLKLEEVGLIVDGIVSDMGSNFIELANTLGVTPENPSFSVSNRNIIYLFDTPHLLKATRNNLIKNTFKFNEMETSWAYIEQFHEKDKTQINRCAPKLTNSHIHPNNFEKMKVKLAAQLLSNTVASALNTHISLGALPPKAMAMVELIDKFNKLFDLLNSSSLKADTIHRNVFRGEEYQIEFLNEMLKFIKSIKVYDAEGRDKTSIIKSLKCWLITINGIKKLWEVTKLSGFKYLFTRRVNQDCLENFFGSIRQQGGNSINPTPIQFEQAFKKLFCQEYFHSKNSNCSNDFDTVLTNLKKLKCGSIVSSSDEVVPTTKLTLPDSDYRNEDVLSQNSFTYVCGYLLKKALKVHNCSTCSELGKFDELEANRLLTYFKAYDHDKSTYGPLRAPNEMFIQYIYKLEKLFFEQFESLSINVGIGSQYLKIFRDIEFSHNCPKFDREYLMKLFIRLRIFYSLKFSNQQFSLVKKGKKQNRKIKILSHL